MNKTHFFRRLTALVLAAGLCMAPVYAESSAEIQEELDELKSQNAEIQAQINAVQSQYDANASDIQALVDKKNAVDQEISLLHEQISNINSQISAYSQLIADTQDALDDAEERLDELNRQYKERIRAMEEGGDVSYWQVLFQANDFTDFLDRVNMIQDIMSSDQKRLDEIQQAADEVYADRTALEDGKTALQSTREELTASEAELEVKRTESDETLRQLAAQQDEFQALIDESEALQDELMQEIAQTQKELQNAQYEEYLEKLALQGENPPSSATWITPVSGYTITSPFGMRTHPILGYQIMHNGIDMACDQGTPIYATRAGTVTKAAYQAGGAGYYVSISHGDGFASIYMHMTHYVVSTGQTVTAGQLIGYVGSTGLSTGPHLHFGVSYAGTYVNPLAYINR